MDPTKPPGDIIPAAYRAEAASWAEDVHGSLRAQARRAWWVAGIASALAVLLAVALVLLLPLKTVVPYTILVDRQTGHAELARGVNLGPMHEDEALLRSTLAQYVIARETIDAGDIAANYKKVGLWSKGVALQDYLKEMDRSNPASILNSANSETQIVTTIKSIAILGKDNALVRFATDRREGAGPVTRRDYAAVVRFGYDGAPLSAEDRLINPLGFQVTHYRRDAETAPPTPSTAPATDSSTAFPAEMPQ